MLNGKGDDSVAFRVSPSIKIILNIKKKNSFSEIIFFLNLKENNQIKTIRFVVKKVLFSENVSLDKKGFVCADLPANTYH